MPMRHWPASSLQYASAAQFGGHSAVTSAQMPLGCRSQYRALACWRSIARWSARGVMGRAIERRDAVVRRWFTDFISFRKNPGGRRAGAATPPGRPTAPVTARSSGLVGRRPSMAPAVSRP